MSDKIQPSPYIPPKPLPPEDFETCLRILEALNQNPDYLIHIPHEERTRLMKAAGRVAHPTIDDHRKISRAARKFKQQQRQKHDQDVRRST